MKTMDFYPKLAFDGIRKNRRMYVPFICTCIGMVMNVLYHFLSALQRLSCCYARWCYCTDDAQSWYDYRRHFFMYFSVLHQFLF